MKIYTKHGDKGETSLIGGERVSKTNSRLEAYGTVDELSANIAFLRDSIIENKKIPLNSFDEQLTELLEILHRLMVVSTLLAANSSMYDKLPRIGEQDIEALEHGINRMNEHIKPVTRFTLPGGDRTISSAHLARTVCRRAERCALRASEQYEIDPLVTKYLNRLSDYLYIIGRKITDCLDVEELYWDGK